MGDTGTYSVIVLLFFFLNSKLKKHIQVSETDNFIKIEMTAVEIQVIKGEILLWEESPYSCHDPSLNSTVEGSTAQTELCQECKASSILLSACRDAAGEKAVCSLFAPGELSSTRNAGLPCIPEQEWVCGALVIQMSTINYMVRSCSTVSHSGGSRLLNSRS